MASTPSFGRVTSTIMRPFGATSVRRIPETLPAHPWADAAIPILPATRVLLAAQMGLPGCALVLARRLRRCAIGQEVAQKAYTLMQDLTFCLIIPLAYIILRKSSHHLLLYLTFTDIHVRHHCATPSFRHHRRLRMLGLYLYVICFLNHHLGSASHHL